MFEISLIQTSESKILQLCGQIYLAYGGSSNIRRENELVDTRRQFLIFGFFVPRTTSIDPKVKPI